MTGPRAAGSDAVVRGVCKARFAVGGEPAAGWSTIDRRGDGAMGSRAGGSFELTAFEPVETEELAGAAFGRVRIAKTFTGGLSGASEVRMLSVGGPDGGPASYVAVEHVTGELDGRRGSFVLQHAAWDTSGTTIRVVPGTGTGELTGITGEFQLTVDASGTHTYVLEYELG
nr:DUF3224 domain-containing protein [Kitasatospora sp. Xyl93]